MKNVIIIILLVVTYMMVGWGLGATLSPHVTLETPDTGNFWFWAWLAFWPVMMVWKGFLVFMIFALPVLIFAVFAESNIMK